ncbi:MAG: alanine dehydrogenase [Armatimonadota bacterium]|nr:alanine dehydrogenase [Armatimonadota bacterium]
MNIGVLREIKNNENRVAVVPSGVETLVRAGHSVWVEAGAGMGTGLSDADYQAAGAAILPEASAVWQAGEIICKVKEPQPNEYPLIRSDQTIFTFFHFAASRELSEAMLDRGATCIAYETVEAPDHTLPLLTPMSEIAGKMAMQEAAKYLEKPQGGRGILLGGVPGVPAAHVVILGGGIVGTNAAKIAAGMGANVTIMDINLERLRYLDDTLPANVTTYFSNPLHIREILPTADVVIGAVLIKGARAPILVTEPDLRRMKPGSVIVDVAVDQGGCIETMHPTTHAVPVFTVDDVIHYGVANIPGAVPATSTYALTNATFPYLLALASKGVRQALRADPGLAKGLNAAEGAFFLPEIAAPFALPQSSLADWLKA